MIKPTSQGKSSASKPTVVFEGGPKVSISATVSWFTMVYLGPVGYKENLQISLTLVLKEFSKRTPSILGFLGSPAYLIWLQ